MVCYFQHFFGSFLTRDEAYRVIVDGWEQHVSDARLLLERQVSRFVSSATWYLQFFYVELPLMVGCLFLFLFCLHVTFYCTTGDKVSK